MHSLWHCNKCSMQQLPAETVSTSVNKLLVALDTADGCGACQSLLLSRRTSRQLYHSPRRAVLITSLSRWNLLTGPDASRTTHWMVCSWDKERLTATESTEGEFPHFPTLISPRWLRLRSRSNRFKGLTGNGSSSPVSPTSCELFTEHGP